MRHLEDKYEDILREADEKEAAEKKRRFAEQTNFLKMNKHGQTKYNEFMEEKRLY